MIEKTLLFLMEATLVKNKHSGNPLMCSVRYSLLYLFFAGYLFTGWNLLIRNFLVLNVVGRRETIMGDKYAKIEEILHLLSLNTVYAALNLNRYCKTETQVVIKHKLYMTKSI